MADGSVEPTRRDFIYYATAGAGSIAGVAALHTMVNQMNPSADVKALSSIRVDVSGLAPGAQLRVKWLGKPVFVRRRTAAEIAEARSVGIDALIDKDARNKNIDAEARALDENRTLDEAGEWLVMVGVCTHLGCIPIDNAGDFGGWYCACHGSHYDISGRVRAGPAPRNLEVPPARFEGENELILG